MAGRRMAGKTRSEAVEIDHRRAIGGSVLFEQNENVALQTRVTCSATFMPRRAQEDWRRMHIAAPQYFCQHIPDEGFFSLSLYHHVKPDHEWPLPPFARVNEASLGNRLRPSAVGADVARSGLAIHHHRPFRAILARICHSLAVWAAARGLCNFAAQICMTDLLYTTRNGATGTWQ